MHKLRFFPLGNADTTLISLENGRELLVDFANVANPYDPTDKRVDLEKELRGYMGDKGKTSFDVVAFSHGDRDHTAAARDFFHLDHAEKYQGGDRFEIEELWVPAGMIVESGSEDDARVLREEAKYRFKKGYGIQVFSRPEVLRGWLEENGLTLESRAHLITDAGKLASGFSKVVDGVEFFVHSPFAHRQDDETLIDRNNNCLVLQATFSVSGVETKALLLADITYEPLDEIVSITRARGNDSRLWWDVCKVAHHCSYKSLNANEYKGSGKTIPTANIDWLYGQRGNGALMISPSDSIPSVDTAQPPHFQAANYYRDKLKEVARGKFLVTMSEPNRSNPRTIIVEIGVTGARHVMAGTLGAAVLTNRTATRVG